jgi:hypothetical protein
MSFFYDVSPDGRSLAAWDAVDVQVYSADGKPPIKMGKICSSAGGENRGVTPACVSWSPDGQFLYLNDRVAGQHYTIPLQPGRNLPAVPPSGFRSPADVLALPGVQVIHEPRAFLGANPSLYAFPRIVTQRNIYRISVP